MANGSGYRETLSEFEKQSAFSRAWNSIRTRYSLATAFLLLLALTIFYIGGRIVLVHLIRDTEQQVKDIGSDISRIAYRNSDQVRKALLEAVSSDGVTGLWSNRTFSVCGRFTEEGVLTSGHCRDSEGGILTIGEEMLVPYSPTLKEWCSSTMAHERNSAATGLMRLCGRSHYVALARSGAECVLLGIPFESSAFTSQVNEGLSGLDIRITNRKAELTATAIVPSREVQRSKERSDFGIAPIFSEAIDFYSGGFWNLGASQYEAVYAVRDIAGNAVTMVAVSIPKSFSSVTQAAIGRLAFFVALVGLVFVLPIFWFQSRVLLNPLTKMTDAIANLGMMHRDTDCPRLEWSGKDEFALLAVSVNRMLETISARSLAVAQSESRQRALIDAIPDALAVFDRQHRLVTMTKDSSDMNGIPFAVPGEEFPEFMFGREGKRKFEESLDRVFAGVKIGSIRLELQHAKWVPERRPSRFFDVRLVRMDEHFALALVRDITTLITEHRQLLGAKKKLLEGEKRQSLALLAAGIAHDINNILTIIGNTTVATWLDSDDPEERRAMDTIADALKRGSMMMRELMDYAGESRITFERVSPKRMIGDIENILTGLLSESVSLEFDIPADIPDVDAGRNQLFKVFMNLVKNAVEAIGKRPGRIVIAARKFEMSQEAILGFRSSSTLKPGTGVLFTVSDNGPGIRADILKRLFDPYVSSKSVGRGLGLATVASVVEAHGGGIRVDSVVERGTTFTIFMPESKLPKPIPVTLGDVHTCVSAGSTCGGEVLVVDDEEYILKTSSMLLKSLNYVAHVAKDGAEALEEVRRHQASLSAIILDASLGDVDTVRLAMAFRQNAPSVPIVISSGSSEEYIRDLFSEARYDAILSKPYTLAELKATLDKVRSLV